jgi:hypothetical protein
MRVSASLLDRYKLCTICCNPLKGNVYYDVAPETGLEANYISIPYDSSHHERYALWLLFRGHYFVDTDETQFLGGTFFCCCTSPQIPLHTAQKIGVMCIIPRPSGYHMTGERAT